MGRALGLRPRSLCCISVSFLFDYLVAFTGGLLLVLARIFEYGSYLQSEYDATL